MPSRKQRRRREKDRRHEYEVIYLDEEGNEVDPPPQTEEKPKSRRDKPKGGGGGGRPGRVYHPPSWTRSGKRALLFFPLFFIVFSIANKHSSVLSRVISSGAYTLLFSPLTYLMDRMAYRAYQRRK